MVAIGSLLRGSIYIENLRENIEENRQRVRKTAEVWANLRSFAEVIRRSAEVFLGGHVFGSNQ